AGTPMAPPLKHQSTIRSVAFHPDGKTILTASGDGTARLWNAAAGTPIVSLVHGHSVTAVAFSPDGQVVLTGSWDGTARLWNAAAGTPLGPPLKHQMPVRAVAFSPDGRTVLTATVPKFVTAQLLL